MVKVSRKYHIRKTGTGKGKVRKNPKTEILVIGIAELEQKLKNIMKKDGLIEEEDKYCTFNCGRILDPDLDHENSYRWCE